jgi:hypothetical protein
MEKQMSRDEFLEDVINIDPLNIDEHFRRVPAELAYYNQQYADAVEAHLKAKAECERTHARVYIELSDVTDDKGKKLTVAAIEANIQMNDDYHIAKMGMLNAEAEKLRLRGKVDVVSAKKEMLISLGAHIRVEMSDPMVRAQAANRGSLDPEY